MLDHWMDQIVTESAIISLSFQGYTKWVINTATRLYESHMQKPGEELHVPPLDEAREELEPHLAVC